MTFAPRVVPAGDSAQMLELGDTLDLAANQRAQRVVDQLRAGALDGVTDIVAGIVTVTVHFAAQSAQEAAARREAVSHALLTAAQRAGRAALQRERRRITIPVCYEGDLAPDLEAVAAATGLARDDVVRRHVASDHRVLMLGFAPGFPYIGGLDRKLDVPRRATPRQRVEAGSVAIANGQTAIYPFATPGGWNVIGRTPLALFDPARDPASLLQAGDRLAFTPINAIEFARLAVHA
jgi:KipI family sensor histidine kinase inhibitor